MHFVVVLDPFSDLGEGQRGGRDRAYLDMVVLEGPHECLAHAVALGAGDRHQGALLRLLWRDWDAAEAFAAELRETAARYGIAQYVAFGGLLGGIAIAAGREPERGSDLVHEGMAALRRIGWAYIVPFAQMNLASALGRTGDGDAALAAAREALRMVRASGELVWEAEALRIRGEVKFAAGAAYRAEAVVDLRASLPVLRGELRQVGELELH